MSKALETLESPDAAAFRDVLDPHVRAIIADELTQLADARMRLAALEYGSRGGMGVVSLSAAPSTFELGTSASITLSWALSREPTAQNVNGFQLSTDARGTVYNGVNGTTQFTLQVEDADAPDGEQKSDSASVTVTALLRRYWGASDSPALTPGEVVALAQIGTDLSGSRAKTFNVDAGGGTGKYVYYAYLAALGDHVRYKLFGYDDDPDNAALTITTAAGLTATYRILRSSQKLTGVVPVEVA
jgi:hypothetical protein